MGIIRLDDLELTMDIAMKLSEIESYKRQWSERKILLSPSFLDSLRRAGTFESIGSSNRIECNTLTDEQRRSFYPIYHPGRLLQRMRKKLWDMLNP